MQAKLELVEPNAAAAGVATPHDLDLERVILASVVADNSVLDKIASLEPDDFYDAVHGALYATMLDLRGEKRPINLVTLKARYGSVPFREGGSVFEYLRGLSFAGNIPDIADVAGSIKELRLRRDMQLLGERIAGAVWDQSVGPATLLTDAAKELDDLLALCRPQKQTLKTMAEAMGDLIEAVQAGDEAKRIPMGFIDLDRMTGGWRRGEYAILAGATSMGKSATAVALGSRAAARGHGVMIFSLEMTTRQWTARAAGDAAWGRDGAVPFAEALRGELNPQQLKRFIAGAEHRAPLPILIDEQAGLTLTDIGARTRRAAEMFERKGQRLGLVIVDHLGKVKPSGRYKGNRVHEYEELSNGMAQLAKSEDVALCCLHQINRNPNQRDNKRPQLSDLRDSGSIEQDADMVMFAYRPAYYLERTREDGAEQEALRQQMLDQQANLLEIIIAKQRNGPTTVVELYCDMASNAVRDRAVGG